MPAFKDSLGREWMIRVDCGALRRVLDSTGVNFGDLASVAEHIERLRLDDLFACEVAWLCSEAQIAEARGHGRGEFEAGMRGEAIKRAFVAVTEGLRDFFRYPSASEIASQFLALVNQTTSGTPSTGSPESSALTPTASP